tara:strand:- start:938 stop:2818 length:1881 start_codon:yes stop_codon:yes gene_type:complete
MDLNNLNNLSQDEIEDILDEANDLYYNTGNYKLKDEEFDFIKDFLIEKFPNTKYKNKIGCEVKKNKTDLPFHLGSMNKIKTEKGVLNWKNKYNGDCCIMDKLDGCSALYEFKNNNYYLYTRGNGTEGSQINHILKYLDLPKINGVSHFVVRGEIIIKNSIFDEKYKDKYSNPRNFVSGILNTEKINKKIIKDLDFIAYEILQPLYKIDNQLITLKNLGFKVVASIIIDNINIDYLKNILQTRKKKTHYLIDGIIIRHNSLYALPISGNPKYAFAFKMDSEEQFGDTIVKNINWNPSKYGYLKPQIVVEPVVIGGVTIRHITGKNAKFIKENKIGIGTELKIKRSGDVIPEIVEILKPNDEPLFPININYKWNKTNVDILINDEQTSPDQINNQCNDSINIKLITDFFKKLKTESLSQGTIKKLYNNGYNTIKKIIHMNIEDFIKLDGFQKTLSEKIYKNIKDSLSKSTIIDLMNASNIFGRGLSYKKLEIIYQNYPHILEMNVNQNLKDKINSINGFSDKTSTQFVDNINNFKKFIKDLNIDIKNKLNKEVYVPVSRKNYVLTGFRSSDLEKKINDMGFNISSNVNKQTKLVITKDLEYQSSKLIKATELNIKIITLDDFIKQNKL